MVVFTEFLGDLPYYIVITLFFSYLLWSNFLNNGRLKVGDDINDLLNILRIFFFILIYLTSIYFFFSTLFGILEFRFNLSHIIQGLSPSIMFIALVSLFVFLTLKEEKTMRIGFRSGIMFILLFYIFIFIGFIAFVVFLLFTPQKHIALDLMFPLFIASLGIWLCYLIGNSIVKLKVKMILEDKKFIKFSFFILIVVFISSIFLTPLTNTNIKKIGYDIYYIEKDYGEVYSIWEISKDIKSFGIIDSMISFITFNIKDSDFYTEKFGSENFKLLVNDSKSFRYETLIDNYKELDNYNDKTNKPYPITKIVFNEEKGIIDLKYDRNKIKEQITQFILRAYKKENFSELNYSYEDNTRYTNVCNDKDKICILRISINNSLDLPVNHIEKTLLNLKTRGISEETQCSFEWINSPFQQTDTLKIYGTETCKSNTCNFYIRDIKKDENVFDLNLFLEEQIIRLEFLKIIKPIEINLNIKVRCVSI